MGVGGEGKKRPYERGKHLKQIKKKKRQTPPHPKKQTQTPSSLFQQKIYNLSTLGSLQNHPPQAKLDLLR